MRLYSHPTATRYSHPTKASGINVSCCQRLSMAWQPVWNAHLLALPMPFSCHDPASPHARFAGPTAQLPNYRPQVVEHLLLEGFLELDFGSTAYATNVGTLPCSPPTPFFDLLCVSPAPACAV